MPTVGWTRSGERVDGAGEEAGTPLVRKVPRPGPAEGEWTGDCGHVVPADSDLARCLDNGGFDTAGNALSSVELFNPQTGTWSRLADMTAARGELALVALGDGSVLAIGGEGADGQGQRSTERSKVIIAF